MLLRKLPISVLLLAATAFFAQPADTASGQLQTLQKDLRQSRAAHDWTAHLAAARRLKALLNDQPSALLQMALSDVRAGDDKSAFRELDQFVRLGQSADLPAQSPDFAPLLAMPAFAALQRQMQANRIPVALGSTTFLLPNTRMIAEDLDYDPARRQFLITSVLKNKIVAATTSGRFHDFALAPDHWSMMAIKIDPVRSIVWTTEVALQGFANAPSSDWGRSALLCYDLNSAKLLRRIEGPAATALGDMALLPSGDVILSDGKGGGIYRLNASGSTLERLDQGDFVSPQTATATPDGKSLFVPDYERGIGILDLATRHVRWLATEGKFALHGIDGLYLSHGILLAVQNGASPERVIRFTLDATATHITSEKILERSTPTLGDPTHGVVVGGDFYYLANSGWDAIDEQGNPRPGSQRTAPRLMRFRLQTPDQRMDRVLGRRARDSPTALLAPVAPAKAAKRCIFLEPRSPAARAR